MKVSSGKTLSVGLSVVRVYLMCSDTYTGLLDTLSVEPERVC